MAVQAAKKLVGISSVVGEECAHVKLLEVKQNSSAASLQNKYYFYTFRTLRVYEHPICLGCEC